MMAKKLNLLDSTMIVMGSMIGSGIFIVSSAMSRDLQTPENLLLAWLITGVLTLFGALSYAELGASMPFAGGQYIYLKEAYGKLAGFLYGWTLFAVIQTGTLAAVAVAFAKFTGVLFPVISETNALISLGGFKISSVQALALAVLLVLTLSNFSEVKKAALVQNLFTLSKIGALLVVIFAGFYQALTGGGSGWHFQAEGLNFSSIGPGVFAAALVGSVFSSDAWNNITFSSSEIENPSKTLPRALILGTGGVTLLYLACNFVYLTVIPFDGIQHAESDRVGTLLMQTLFGATGGILMAVLIMISTFGCINGLTLSGARVYYAMAKDGYFLAPAAKLNKQGSPQTALILQFVWAAVLTLSGSYGDLLDYVVFAVLLFYILTVAGLFILRKRQPELERPYKVTGYPILPAIYILLAAAICISLLIWKPLYSFRGLMLVLSGIPIYYLIKAKTKAV
ncbi:amino acid permease [Bacteroidota bacterium]